MALNTVRALIQNRPLHSIDVAAPVTHACQLLKAHDIGVLAVLKEGALMGVLSARDVVRRCNAKGRDPQATRVSEIMTRDIRVAFIDDSLAEAWSVMREGGLRHLPVVDDEGLPVSMLSIDDIPSSIGRMQAQYEAFVSETAPAPQAHMGHL